MNKEKYIPPSEEVKEAEEMMTEEEIKMSEEREATFGRGALKQRRMEMGITPEIENIIEIIDNGNKKRFQEIIDNERAKHGKKPLLSEDTAQLTIPFGESYKKMNIIINVGREDIEIRMVERKTPYKFTERNEMSDSLKKQVIDKIIN